MTELGLGRLEVQLLLEMVTPQFGQMGFSDSPQTRW